MTDRKEYQKRYFQENKEKLRIERKDYQRNYRRKYYEDNKEKLRKYSREYSRINSPPVKYLSDKELENYRKKCALHRIKYLNSKRKSDLNHVYKIRFGGADRREFVIQRDSEACKLCGITRKEHKELYGKDITVDHIDGSGGNNAISKNRNKLRNNDLSNLRTLCLVCNFKVARQMRKDLINQ